MKPAPFDYHAPQDVQGAVALLAEHGDDAKILAGGQSLVPLLSLRLARFDALIDVNRVAGLSGISERDGELVIGAGTRQADVERDPLVRRHAPLLAEGTALVGHFQIRNRGTIGGSLAHADPAAEHPAMALALDAELDVVSASGSRTIAAADLVEFAYVTAIAPDELLTTVRYPKAPPRTGHAIEEVARRHGDFALTGVCAVVSLDESAAIARARVVAFGVSERAIRLESVEQALVGSPAAAVDVEDAIAAAVEQLDPPSDVQATAEYRRAVTGPLVVRAIAKAVGRAQA